MSETPNSNQLKSFLETVKQQGLIDDLSKAARHHSAVNVAEADSLIQKLNEQNNKQDK
jgi:hypothetical protein